MHQLLPTKSHEEKMQKSEEEHSFSDELNGNWIKILDLNKIRKEKEMQRKQHLEDVKMQRDKTTTESEEEKRNCKKEKLVKEKLPEKSRQDKET
jgi:hypothetical protein